MFSCDRDGVVSCVNKGGDGVRLCNIIGGDGVSLLDTIDGVDGDSVMSCDITGDDVVVYDIINGGSRMGHLGQMPPPPPLLPQ